MHRFSIIIPVYNVALYLRACLDSVLSQTYRDWECICVDDGSTDGSGAILDEYAKRDKRFRVIHQLNAGVSAARNAAIEVANGDWVTFVDADDWILPRWLENAMLVIDQQSVDVVRMDLQRWTEGGRLPEDLCSSETIQLVESGEIVDWIMSHAFRHSFSWLLFIRKDVLKGGTIRFPIGMTMCEDTVFLLRLMPGISRLAQTNYAGYVYRVRGESVSQRARKREQVEKIFEEFRNSIPEAVIPRYVNDITQEMLYPFWEWLWSDNSAERHEDARLCRLMVRALQYGLIGVSGMNKRYLLGYFGLRLFKTLKLFYVNHAMLKLSVVLRKKSRK